jgi:hypothetical protein
MKLPRLISLGAILPPKNMSVSSIFGDDWRRRLDFRKYTTDAFHCSSFYILLLAMFKCMAGH